MTTVGARLDRLIKEKRHDPYQDKKKLSEPTVCPGCGAVYHKGHWSWAERPVGAHETSCPACQRIHDKVPAGFVSLGGAFYKQHQAEINKLIHNIVEREKESHPLNRIMEQTETDAGLEITTTDMHLPRDIGVALERAYEGELDFHYEDGEYQLRVSWQR